MKSGCVLTGYYGMNNFGDDIFCQVAAWGVNKYWGKQARFLVDNLPIFPDFIDYHHPLGFKIKGHASIFQYYESLFSSMIVYSGGSIFHSQPKTFYSAAYFQYFLSQFGKNLGAIGISVGPFKSQKDYRWIKKFLSRFSFIATRDQQSYEILMDMNLSNKLIQAFDLAVLYPKIIDCGVSIKQFKKRKIVGVNLCHYERYIKGNLESEKFREEKLFQTIKLLLERNDNVQVRFFVLNSNPFNGDNAITKNFIERLNIYKQRIQIIEYKNDPITVYKELINCDLMLGVRLHAAIMAYSAGTPFILIEYHPKCTNFLDDIAYPQQYRVGNHILDPLILYDRIEKILSQDRLNFFAGLFPLEKAQNIALNNFTEAPWFKEAVIEL
jgi:polysaccharide pyruvyl transferase WcaK-like protein